jgi:hypothetical protein
MREKKIKNIKQHVIENLGATANKEHAHIAKY